MTTFRDPTSVHAQIHKKKSLRLDQSRNAENGAAKSSRLAKRASIAGFSSLVKDGVSWAGDRLNTYRDGLSREEREEKVRRENRKQLLYLKMQNVRQVSDREVQPIITNLYLLRLSRLRNGARVPANWMNLKATTSGRKPWNPTNIIQPWSWNE